MIEAIFQIQQILYECDGICALLFLFDHDQAAALLAQIARYAFGNRLQRIVVQAREQFVHAGKIVGFRIFDHVHDAAVLHFDNRLHVLVDQFIFDHFYDARLGFFIQIEFGSFRFFIDAGLRMLREERKRMMR